MSRVDIEVIKVSMIITKCPLLQIKSQKEIETKSEKLIGYMSLKNLVS